MKNLLLLANLNHASPRIPGIMAHISRCGWRAHIVTPAFSDSAPGVSELFRRECRIIPAPYGGDALMFWRRLLLRRGFTPGSSMTEQLKAKLPSGRKNLAAALVNWYQALFNYPDAENTWIKPALRAALAESGRTRFDVVLSSSPYPSSHYAALRVKTDLGIPWAADLRDLWSRNHNYPFFALRRRLDECLERRLLRRADTVVTVSPSLAEEEADLLCRSVSVVTNGYEPAPADGLRDRDAKFSIVYTGPIYEGRQDPSIPLKAARALLDGNELSADDLSIDFYGPKLQSLDALIKKLGLEGVARQHGSISHSEAVRRQRGAQVLLFLQWDAARKGIYTTKLFEYLAARRPILATGAISQDGPADIIKATSSGELAEDVQSAARAIKDMYAAYRRDGAVPYRGSEEAVRRFEYPQLAAAYAAILDGLTEAR